MTIEIVVDQAEYFVLPGAVRRLAGDPRARVRVHRRPARPPTLPATVPASAKAPDPSG